MPEQGEPISSKQASTRCIACQIKPGPHLIEDHPICAGCSGAWDASTENRGSDAPGSHHFADFVRMCWAEAFAEKWYASPGRGQEGNTREPWSGPPPPVPTVLVPVIRFPSMRPKASRRERARP